jgi:hypothetical protein
MGLKIEAKRRDEMTNSKLAVLDAQVLQALSNAHNDALEQLACRGGPPSFGTGQVCRLVQLGRRNEEARLWPKRVVLLSVTEAQVRSSLRRLKKDRKVVECSTRGTALEWRLRNDDDVEKERLGKAQAALALAVEAELVRRGVDSDEANDSNLRSSFRLNTETLAKLLGVEVK